MIKVANIILEYESDTFSAIDMAVTPAEAHAMAGLLFERFCKVVAESGTFRCDGDVLAHYLDEVRDDGDE